MTSLRRKFLYGLRHWFQPKFSQDILRGELINAFKGNAVSGIVAERVVKLGHSRKRLVIPTYDALMGRIFLFKTAHHQQFRYDIDALAADIGVATAAAPTYFSAAPFPEHPGSSYIDGEYGQTLLLQLELWKPCTF